MSDGMDGAAAFAAGVGEHARKACGCSLCISGAGRDVTCLAAALAPVVYAEALKAPSEYSWHEFTGPTGEERELMGKLEREKARERAWQVEKYGDYKR